MLDLVVCIQQAQDDLHRLYEEVRGDAVPSVLDRRSCRISDLLREAWERLVPSRTGRDALLQARGDPDLACSGDAFQLIQVFRNILDNALAAAHDPVVIDVEWAETNAAGQPAVGIVIRDNGPGLTPEQRCNLFEPFYTTKTEGTGLGMAIAKECAGNNFPVFPKYVIKPSARSQTGRRAAWTPMHRKSNGR